MHIECFKYFYEVALSRSISKVANSCHISQSALSQQIQRMEDSLGYKLLDRSNKGVELTEEGKIVEKYAKSILKTYDNMIDELESRSNNINTIKIASSATIGTYALPCTLFNIKNKFPKNNYELSTNFDMDVEQVIMNELSDVGFIYGEPTEKSLCYDKVGRDRLVLACSSDFNIKSEITLEELKKHPIILLQERVKMRQSMNSYLKDIGYHLKDFNILFNLDSTESIKSSLNKGYGLSFLPYISIKSELYTGSLKEIKVSDFEMDYPIYMLYKDNKYNNAPLKSFVQYIKKIGEKSFC
jgi:LysR family transcriptional regulator, transcriptional activator of the cysJI operon